MSKVLNKMDIIKADDSVFVYEDVPEWGGKVKLYAMTLEETMEFEKLRVRTRTGSVKKAEHDQILYILRKSICDEEGNPLFSEEEAKVLLSKSTKVVYRIFMKCAKLNKENTPDIGILEKN